MSKVRVFTSLICLGLTTMTQATPLEIQFTNNTSVALNTEIAGLPGRGIESNVSKSVFVGIVQVACNQANSMNNCPLHFFNKQTGEKVASVNMNVNNFTLTSPPVLYGEYNQRFNVTGWESNPITHITISERS